MLMGTHREYLDRLWVRKILQEKNLEILQEL